MKPRHHDIYSFIRHLLQTLMLVACINIANAATVTVAVASNFKNTAEQLSRVFTEQSGHKLRIVSASSGKLYAQIMQNAPFDIFLSADQHKPLQLHQQGKTISGHRLHYATGQLVLWSANQELAVRNCLINACFSTLAMANPKHAPYGIAASEVLNQLNIHKTDQQRYIVGENINQSLQFIQSHNADLGFIAASQLQQLPIAAINNAYQAGNIWIIPQSYYSAIKQDAVMLKRAINNKAAEAFWQFLQSNSAKDIIKANGYHVK